MDFDFLASGGKGDRRDLLGANNGLSVSHHCHGQGELDENFFVTKHSLVKPWLDLYRGSAVQKKPLIKRKRKEKTEKLKQWSFRTSVRSPIGLLPLCPTAPR